MEEPFQKCEKTWSPLDSAPKNRFGLSVIFSFNLVQLKGIYQNFAISRAFNIAPRPLKTLRISLRIWAKKSKRLILCPKVHQLSQIVLHC